MGIGLEVVMPTIQKAPRSTRSPEETSYWAKALPGGPSLSVTSLFMWRKKACPFSKDSCQELQTRAMEATDVFKLGKQRGRGWVSSCCFFVGFYLHKKCTIVWLNRQSNCAVWRPFEPWTKPAGRSPRLASNQKQYVQQGKPFQKDETS